MRGVAAVEAMGKVGDNYGMDENTPKNRWAGVDSYLTALYGRPITSIDMLRGLELNEQAIATLRELHQEAFAARVVAGLRAQFEEAQNGDRQFYVVTRFFGLDGDVPWQAAQIAEEMQISPTRVRQIRTRAMRRLKSAAEVARLKEIVREAAHGCLGEA